MGDGEENISWRGNRFCKGPGYGKFHLIFWEVRKRRPILLDCKERERESNENVETHYYAGHIMWYLICHTKLGSYSKFIEKLLKGFKQGA